MTDQNDYRIRVRHLSKVFGKRPGEVLALRDQGKKRAEIHKATGQVLGLSDINFDVRAGELLVIMGLSGSGKSTLIRCLNRLIDPTEGEILINGGDVVKMNDAELRECRRRHFSMVFQHFALFPHRTLLGNAEYGLEVRGVPQSVRQEKAMAALKRVGLGHLPNAYPHELSGGMQQRVGLARALASETSVMLMDEAFSALDPLIRREMQDELLMLQKDLKQTIIFITHDLDEALHIGDRIILLKDGEVVQAGTPRDIVTNPADEYVERFVEGIDMTRFLTAELAMEAPVTPLSIDDTVGAALTRMNEHDGLETLYVNDADGKLAGVVERSVLEDAAPETPLVDVLERDVPRVLPREPLNRLFPLFRKRNYPVAVVDRQSRLRGIVVRGRILSLLAESDNDAVEPEVEPPLASLDDAVTSTGEDA
ncbi:quaternary amine ABC transporter ATP-binding protein [Zymobacter palmae]|uniref:Quaternary amine transport ATP-binding protein n=1 Tax=Zymobacter palmae TaxID=33074 RepID=A0A348HH76_9GAMM|nr:glycine betaine/L-proline ABC transporter ATP-binding protein [Zymobacter palmae]BBG30978.1 glycine betaine/L-proline transport ATP binding subunit [Zymobacter palmae]